MEKPIVSMDKELQPTFIVDGMLGSLARWLRLLGFDTLYCEITPDDEILKVTGNRILLTRDKELIKRAQKQGLTVVNPGPRPISKMLLRLKEKLHLIFEIKPEVSRCPQCNSLIKPTTPEMVKDKVPPASYKRHREFWQCSNVECEKVYWQGRHWKRIQQTLDVVKSG